MTTKPIVAGVDGSPESLRAVALAWRIARAADTNCIPVYAVPEIWAPGAMAPLVNSGAAFDVLVSDLRHLLARELGAEIPVATLQALIARPGRPGVVLDQVVRERDAALVVVGGRYHGALSRGLGGSTAHHLVRTSPAPVLVVRDTATTREPRRMLVATDLSLTAPTTLSVARGLAELLGMQMRVVHVVEPARFPTVVPLSLDPAVVEQHACEEFHRVLELELPDVPPDERVLRHGRADEAIANEATAWQADWLVVGSHGRGWIDRLLIGSTTERLLNRLPASLLVVPITRPATLDRIVSARGAAAVLGSSYSHHGARL